MLSQRKSLILQTNFGVCHRKIILSDGHWNPESREVNPIYGLLSFKIIRLIMVFDATLTGRQGGQKLKRLYGNQIANNFFQT